MTVIVAWKEQMTCLACSETPAEIFAGGWNTLPSLQTASPNPYRSPSACSQANLLLDDLTFLLPDSLKNRILLIGLQERLKTSQTPLFPLTLTLHRLTHIHSKPSCPQLRCNFDQNLSFSDHIMHLSRSCFINIRDLRRIRYTLDLKTASTIATSIVHATLDYCDSLFLTTELTQINRLQLQAMQNALARAATKGPRQVCHNDRCYL